MLTGAEGTLDARCHYCIPHAPTEHTGRVCRELGYRTMSIIHSQDKGPVGGAAIARMRTCMHCSAIRLNLICYRIQLNKYSQSFECTVLNIGLWLGGRLLFFVQVTQLIEELVVCPAKFQLVKPIPCLRAELDRRLVRHGLADYTHYDDS